MGGLTIGQIAKRAGVGIGTVRYYERRGLLSVPPRTDSGYRLYPEDTAEKILFIKRAQELGFTLEEISKLASVFASEAEWPAADMRCLAQEKIREIDRRITQLIRLKSLLEQAANHSESTSAPAGNECPIILACSKGGSTNG